MSSKVGQSVVKQPPWPRFEGGQNDHAPKGLAPTLVPTGNAGVALASTRFRKSIFAFTGSIALRDQARPGERATAPTSCWPGHVSPPFWLGPTHVQDMEVVHRNMGGGASFTSGLSDNSESLSEAAINICQPHADVSRGLPWTDSPKFEPILGTLVHHEGWKSESCITPTNRNLWLPARYWDSRTNHRKSGNTDFLQTWWGLLPGCFPSKG